MSKSNKTSSSANSFGSGKDLIGMTCKGKEIVDASRQYMYLSDGQKVERSGNKVEYDRIEPTGTIDTCAYMTDDL